MPKEVAEATEAEVEWPQFLDGGWHTSDGYRFVTANAENADRVEEKARAHQERVNAGAEE